MRIARHNGLADLYAGIVEEVGGIAQREVFVPELSSRNEAWLDVWAYGVLEIPDALLDITVRHAGSQSYQPEASKQTGLAAARGEKDKLDRYPARVVVKCGQSLMKPGDDWETWRSSC